ncbi:hypothetical protein IMSHALPRED_004107 [Imshaugia aleurites]|uniref:Uncharacterized protein n=1 Tax=Imshaugia aleurites TaxID=172621 RepID=A0A8H3HX78_9LECA|nr:hypothetical protein IMSHALPRED_004107 [Imshaugia aleurites]
MPCTTWECVRIDSPDETAVTDGAIKNSVGENREHEQKPTTEEIVDWLRERWGKDVQELEDVRKGVDTAQEDLQATDTLLKDFRLLVNEQLLKTKTLERGCGKVLQRDYRNGAPQKKSTTEKKREQAKRAFSSGDDDGDNGSGGPSGAGQKRWNITTLTATTHKPRTWFVDSPKDAAFVPPLDPDDEMEAGGDGCSEEEAGLKDGAQNEEEVKDNGRKPEFKSKPKQKSDVKPDKSRCQYLKAGPLSPVMNLHFSAMVSLDGSEIDDAEDAHEVPVDAAPLALGHDVGNLVTSKRPSYAKTAKI